MKFAYISLSVFPYLFFQHTNYFLPPIVKPLTMAISSHYLRAMKHGYNTTNT